MMHVIVMFPTGRCGVLVCVHKIRPAHGRPYGMFAVDLGLSMTCTLYAVTSGDQHILLLSTESTGSLSFACTHQQPAERVEEQSYAGIDAIVT